MEPSRELSRLIEIMAALRDPVDGCPWDLDQTFESIRHYTIEEAYEVADAIERADYEDLCEELGDLLLQSVYHAQLAREQSLFDIGDVIYAVTSKLIRRHPHVFGDNRAEDADAATVRWETIKASERANKSAARDQDASVLDNVPNNLPALVRAEKLAKRAARVGFDWPNSASVVEKVREEVDEVVEAARDGSAAAVHEEIGDLLFSVANLARHYGVDPEAALRDANRKFTRRFQHIERRAGEDNVNVAEAGLERLDGYWNEIRLAEKSG
ncbi:nucleoside triphosphate pyrophosphohydrolase [Devosia pacifica]|uniref:Nucleoside triphosphate pyrophosphohydrolase n=1 Tax=Devosia pacifica TaxID=1335967 RepID=A0A918RT77_9HYPH|nr:nucleoside triphosphate pyrophosphohydrolase [Devosia pacifica]GHA11838.1 nucleoside triphosphate pyrophosphohydrolase [Devosia pacifica]